MIGTLRRADVVVSRAGAGTVQELMAIGKPSIFVPLAIAQRNEQYHNAMEAHERLGSIVITEDKLSEADLMALSDELLGTGAPEVEPMPNGTQLLADRIAAATR